MNLLKFLTLRAIWPVSIPLLASLRVEASERVNDPLSAAAARPVFLSFSFSLQPNLIRTTNNGKRKSNSVFIQVRRDMKH